MSAETGPDTGAPIGVGYPAARRIRYEHSAYPRRYLSLVALVRCRADLAASETAHTGPAASLRHGMGHRAYALGPVCVDVESWHGQADLCLRHAAGLDR